MDQHEPPAEPTDAEIDEVLAEFGGRSRGYCCSAPGPRNAGRRL